MSQNINMSEKATTLAPQESAHGSAPTIGSGPSGSGKDLEIIKTDVNSGASQSKQKRLKSDVWNHFNREVKSNKEVEATCKYCNRKFSAPSRSGTTHLKNHMDSYIHRKRKSMDIKQCMLGKSTTSIDLHPNLCTHKFDPDVERDLFVKMITKHDFPFMMAQYDYFRLWISYIMPTYKFRSRNTIKSDLMHVYNVEKSTVYNEIEKLVSRVALTTDGWKPKHQNSGYFCVTCHYIDDTWTLCKKIIALRVVHYPHDGASLCEWLNNRILEWNIDKKLSSVVVDNASNNAGMLDGIKVWLNGKNALLDGGSMFHLRCCAHIINIIVKSGLDVIHELIEGIRKSVLYINHSPKRGEQFERALLHCRLNPKKRVSLDVDTRWNSTYDMLNDALGLKLAFERLADLDNDYKLLPSSDEWEKGKKISECLKVFSDVTKRFSGCKYPTTNYYFLDIWKIRMKLKDWQASGVGYIEEMSILMQEKFNKYWDDCSMVLTIAIVLDPRYKMKIVECVYSQMYGEFAYVYTEKVHSAMNKLYAEYETVSRVLNVGDIGDSSSNATVSKVTPDDEVLGMFKNFVAQTSSHNDPRISDLEQYLKEGLEPLIENEAYLFDIMDWWKRNGPKFPTVAKMARDILAIPASSVASESAFSQARRIVTDTCASLNSETLKALICTKDWLPSLENVEQGSQMDVLVDEVDDQFMQSLE